MPDIELKTFAEAVYRVPAAQTLLLDCQDRLGLDVLCLLGACWLGVTGRELGSDGWSYVLVSHAAWRDEVIRPLRRARRAIKPVREAAGLYRQVKQSELNAEWLALGWLESMLSDRATAGVGQAEMLIGRSIQGYCGAERRAGQLPADVGATLARLAMSGCADALDGY